VLARYRIVRGRRDGEPLPAGRRLDIRKHQSHILSPEPAMVSDYLAAPGDEAFARFAQAYGDLLSRRFATRRDRFDALAAEARAGDVYLGCNCPTRANPRVERCHTVLALAFMRERYPDLDVRFPPGAPSA
jgi:hypothetical protein